MHAFDKASRRSEDYSLLAAPQVQLKSEKQIARATAQYKNTVSCTNLAPVCSDAVVLPGSSLPYGC